MHVAGHCVHCFLATTKHFLYFTNFSSFYVKLLIMQDSSSSKPGIPTVKSNHWLIVNFFNPARKYFSHIETSPLPVNGSMLMAFEHLSSNTCCDTEPWFLRSHPKQRHSPSKLEKKIYPIYYDIVYRVIFFFNLDGGENFFFHIYYDIVYRVIIFFNLDGEGNFIFKFRSGVPMIRRTVRVFMTYSNSNPHETEIKWKLKLWKVYIH